MRSDWKRICAEFLEATSYSPAELEEASPHRSYDRANRPDTYLTYPDAEARIPLGAPDLPEGTDFWQTVGQRRSKRNFLPVPLSLNQLNCLLWATQGITEDMGDYQLRTAPSAGALYPIETYLGINMVEGVEPGIYHLDVRGWALEALRIGDVRDEVEANDIPFAKAVEMGVFCEPAKGVIDFKTFRDVLEEVDFEGWAIVEQDMYPAPFDKPLPIAKRTRAYLREIGFG